MSDSWDTVGISPDGREAFLAQRVKTREQQIRDWLTGLADGYDMDAAWNTVAPGFDADARAQRREVQRAIATELRGIARSLPTEETA